MVSEQAALLLNEETSAHSAGRPMARVQTDREKEPGTGKTVLIVDDNRALRQAVARAFLSDGFSVCGEADNGKEAVELAKELKPDLVILDLSMPVMNGLEAAPKLRKLLPDVPIILLTLYGNRLQREEAAALGINLVLSKTEELRKIIEQAHQLVGD